MSATKPLLPSYFDAENLVIGAKNTQTKDYSLDGEDVTVTTDKVTGGLCILNTVDEDSLNPVTGKAVAEAIAQGGGGGSLEAGDGIAITEGTISAKVDGETIGINASGELEALGGGSSERFMAVVNQTSFMDIWNAYIAGKEIWATKSGEEPDDPQLAEARIYRLNYIWHPSQNSGEAAFTSLEYNGSLYTECWNVDTNDTWRQNTYQGVLVPSVSYNPGYVLTENAYGGIEWATPSGGFEAPVLTHGVAVAADGSYFGDQGAANSSFDPYFKRTAVGTSVWAVGISSNKLRMAYPWSYSLDNDGYKVAIFLQGRSSTDLSGYVPVWFPTNSDSVQLRYLGTVTINDGTTVSLHDYTNPLASPTTLSVCRVRNILPPPSVKPDMEVDTSLWSKVGDWSSITSPIYDWRFGFYNPTSEQLLPIDEYDYPAYVYHPNWLEPKYFCGVDIPPINGSADEGKILKIVSGKATWVTP